MAGKASWSAHCAGCVFLVFVAILAAPAAPMPDGLSEDDQALIQRPQTELAAKLDSLRAGQVKAANPLADAAIYLKGVEWALRYETKLAPDDVKLIKKSLERCRQRLDALAAGKPAWPKKKGKVVRGFVSAVDGSVQPYGVIIPVSYDSSKSNRLDVVLHGSSRPIGLSELRFMNRFDEGDAADGRPAPAADFIELHPLGRVENCYRWAGETDVFEAIESVAQNYAIDRDRIVLRGMSMGGSGTWHLGLKHPDRFVALGPYCGYVDTHEFSHLPYKHFIKVGPLPPYQEKALHMLDSVDYAANAGMVPAIACMGEKDEACSCHVLMNYAMRKEGLQMINLISPGTGHVVDPVTFKEEMRQIGEYAQRGRRPPREIRFVTWTLKYPRCYWLEVLGLKEHYARAEISARILDDHSIDVTEPKNISRFAISSATPSATLRVNGQLVGKFPPRAERRPHPAIVGLIEGQWKLIETSEQMPAAGKRPGLQGPIDDAFTAPLLCVRGTGTPWNPVVQAWSEANLHRFAYEWHRYFRGELPIKKDSDVTADDLKKYNLILFGDPGSNRWIEKALPRLPITWTREQLTRDGKTYSANDHLIALIQPNPLPGAEGRYLVLNSGHTFHEKELAAVNYLLFPRLGDWAVLKVGLGHPPNPSDPLEEEVIAAGFFKEDWR